MSLTMKNDGGNFTPAPAGNHIATCISVIDLGTQHNDAFTYQDKHVPASDRPQIMLIWELPTEMVEFEGKQAPATISKFYNASFNEKATLRLHLEAWRTREFSEEELCGFNIANLLNKPCMLNVIHNDAGKAKIAGVAAMPKGVPVPDPHHPLIMFDLDEYDDAVFNGISEGIKKIIMKSPEWQAMNGQKPTGFRENHGPSNDVAGDNAAEPDGFTDDMIPF